MRGLQKSIGLALLCAPLWGTASASSVVDTRVQDSYSQNPYSQGLQYNNLEAAQVKNSVRLRCDVGAGRVKQSRALVLQLDETAVGLGEYEVALTTAHGLLDQNAEVLDACQIMDARGQSHKVEYIAPASNTQSGTRSDWAIIVFKKPKDSRLLRYELPDFVPTSQFEKMATDDFSVKFSTAIGLSYNGQSCSLISRKTAGLLGARYLGFLAHDCFAVSGQSGTPISVLNDGVPVVLGMHVGNSFSFGEPSKNVAPRFYGYMRVFDKGFVEEVEQLLVGLENAIVDAQDK